MEEENITSYADDTTQWYSSGNNVAPVFEDIETKGKTIFHWFSMKNYLKANPGKSQRLVTSKKLGSITSYLLQSKTLPSKSSSKKLPKVLLDNKLIFNDEFCKLCKKPSQRLHALASSSDYLSKAKTGIFMNVYFTTVRILPFILDVS